MPTFPGFHPNFDFQRYPATIRSALRRIADTFYVTRSFEVERVGNSSYYAALIRPTEEASVVLNTQRELLVVFANYETFEIRTLECFDKFYSYAESARIDKTMRFLISSDSDVERGVRLYLEQHPEYPVIVPLTFDQLERRANPLISAVRQNYFIRDLFGFQSPLREEHFFFGRAQIVAGTIDAAKSGQHSSLFGLRKSGKTSTIYAIQRRCKPSELNVVTFDCQDLAIHSRTYGRLLAHIVDKVRANASLRSISHPDIYEGAEISEWFHRNMQQTLNSLQSNLLIIFDEIENISPKTAASEHWRSELDPIYFWQVIRSFSQTSKGRTLSICLVGTSPYILEQAKINDIDNPAYLLAQKRFIPNLTFEETKEMVSRLGFFMGLDFDPAAISQLHNSYGGHPFFTRQICSKVHQLTTGQRPRQVPLVRINEAQRSFAAQLEAYLNEIISNLKSQYISEFDLLANLVKSGNEIEEYAKEAPELIDHLLGYGLITLRDGVPEIAFGAVEKAVLSQTQPPITRTLEEKWSELVIKRGTVEQAVRKAIAFSAKSLDSTEWCMLLEKRLSKKRFGELNSTDIRYLFSNETSPLYLSDLISILEDERIAPFLADKRSDIRRALHAVNGLRGDAHAKNISDAELKLAGEQFILLFDEFMI